MLLSHPCSEPRVPPALRTRAGAHWRSRECHSALARAWSSFCSRGAGRETSTGRRLGNLGWGVKVCQGISTSWYRLDGQRQGCEAGRRTAGHGSSSVSLFWSPSASQGGLSQGQVTKLLSPSGAASPRRVSEHLWRKACALQSGVPQVVVSDFLSVEAAAL